MPTNPSSTQQTPDSGIIPQHIAIIMDGNGRWAKKRVLPRIAGHKQGVEAIRNIVKACIEREVKYLTIFAFSSENWRRPHDEVSSLMQLFISALEQEIAKLHENGVCFKVIGDLSKFEPKIVNFIRDGEKLTLENSRLTLTVAANYGGRWDILQAINKMVVHSPASQGVYEEKDLTQFLSMNYAPEPDLFIRTGGEYRISNFLLWHLAYTELYFTNTLWPDFDACELDLAIQSFQRRERRFGRTSEQLTSDIFT